MDQPENVTFVSDTTLENAHMGLNANLITDVGSVENTVTGHTTVVEFFPTKMIGKIGIDIAKTGMTRRNVTIDQEEIEGVVNPWQ